MVKFFGCLFGGQVSYAKEQEVSRLLGLAPEIPAPGLIAQGLLLEEGDSWPWPYLIFEYVSGASIGDIFEQLSLLQRLLVAREMGKIVRHFHALPLEAPQVFESSWRDYAQFLSRQAANCQQNQRSWGSLPGHLIDQIGEYLLPPEELIDWSRQPHLIHADLTRDHWLGRLGDGSWQTLALIDFGDARVGDLLYELVALHLDLFDGDPRLLHAFLDTYGSDLIGDDEFPHRAMSTALLHEFDVFSGLARRYPGWQEIRSLPELAGLIWKTELPGH